MTIRNFSVAAARDLADDLVRLGHASAPAMRLADKVLEEASRTQIIFDYDRCLGILDAEMRRAA